MFSKVFGVFAPAIFTKSIYRYNKGEYVASLKLLKRAAKWMPGLKDDGLLPAYLFLIDYHLGKKINVQEVNTVIENLSNSSLKDGNWNPEPELKSILYKDPSVIVH